MRFECDSCHAQYKISDEKVRGRVVRFPCRKCEHRILIDGRRVEPADVTVPAGAAYGLAEAQQAQPEPSSSFQHEAPTAKARRTSSPVRRRPPSVPPPRRPAPASRKLAAPAATAREPKHPGLAPPVPAQLPSSGDKKRDAAEWHVSIHDVPVGPIRLEEMGHKIDAGAVSEYSLVWREGFEEWRPLATVPELVALLHERRASGLPARTSFSSMPPFVDPGRASEPPDEPDELPSLADSLQPEMGFDDYMADVSQPPAPIGPPDVFESSPSLGSYSGLPPAPDEAVSVPSVPPEPAAATAEPRRGPSMGTWALIVALALFAGVSAYLAFERYGDSLWTKWLGTGPSSQAPAGLAPSAPVGQKPSAAPDEPAQGEERAEGMQAETAGAPEEGSAKASPPSDAWRDDADEQLDRIEEPSAKGSLIVPPPNPAGDGPAIEPAPTPTRRPQRPSPRAPRDEAKDSKLSVEEEKELREFEAVSTAAPAEIAVKEPRAAQNDEPPLDADGVRATVAANKPRLQRCYERAVRGQQSAPAVRLDVNVMVAPSGRVKSVNAAGTGPGGLAECVEASIRRWRFPVSSEGGPAEFPIVFSAN